MKKKQNVVELHIQWAAGQESGWNIARGSNSGTSTIFAGNIQKGPYCNVWRR